MPRIQPVMLVALACTSVVLYARVAHGHDYPTVDRVEFVLECMQRNEGKQEFLYKCSCVVDELARKFSYDDFVEAASAARYQTLGGELVDHARTLIEEFLLTLVPLHALEDE